MLKEQVAKIYSLLLWGNKWGYSSRPTFRRLRFYQVIGEILKPVRNYLVNKYHIYREAFSHYILKVLFTFVLVDFAWLFFRAGTIEKSKELFKYIFRFNPEILIDGSLYTLGLQEYEFYFLFLSLIILGIADYFKYRKINILEKLGRQGIWFRSAAFVLLFWSVILFGVFGPDYEASQFIYFQF